MSSPDVEQWIEAMAKELVPRPQRKGDIPGRPKNISNTKWVYTVKIDVNGTEFAKARLVSIGCEDSNQYRENYFVQPYLPT